MTPPPRYERGTSPSEWGGTLTVTDVSVRRGGRQVIDRLSFSLDAGQLLLLSGRNGSGKTSLLRALALLVPVSEGAIRWHGSNVGDDREAWHGRLAWLGHSDGLKGDLSAVENLASAERLRGGAEAARHDIDRALLAFDLPEIAQRPVHMLSAGQRRRVALARVVLSKAPLWLLDEPLNALDAPAQQLLINALATHLAQGGMAIAATHAALDVAGALKLELAS